QPPEASGGFLQNSLGLESRAHIRPNERGRVFRGQLPRLDAQGFEIGEHHGAIRALAGVPLYLGPRLAFEMRRASKIELPASRSRDFGLVRGVHGFSLSPRAGTSVAPAPPLRPRPFRNPSRSFIRALCNCDLEFPTEQFMIWAISLCS